MSTQQGLTHIDEVGAARMVDVSEKDVTARTATASGRVLVSPRVVELLRGRASPRAMPSPPPVSRASWAPNAPRI